MSLNALVIPATVGTTTVTIQRPLQDDFVEQPSGNRELEAGSGCWGVDGSGQAYFDPAGSVDGEHAVLVANDKGELFLLPQGAGFRAEVRRPDGHLFPGHLPPRERVIRPLERRGDGRVFGPTEARAAGRDYDRRTDGRLLEPAGGRRPARELPRGENGRVHPATPSRRPARTYPPARERQPTAFTGRDRNR